jgi:hypothetical protein
VVVVVMVAVPGGGTTFVLSFEINCSAPNSGVVSWCGMLIGVVEARSPSSNQVPLGRASGETGLDIVADGEVEFEVNPSSLNVVLKFGKVLWSAFALGATKELPITVMHCPSGLCDLVLVLDVASCVLDELVPMVVVGMGW